VNTVTVHFISAHVVLVAQPRRGAG